jgi:hypothetical protein
VIFGSRERPTSNIEHRTPNDPGRGQNRRLQIFFLTSWLPDSFILLNGLMEITARWRLLRHPRKSPVRIEFYFMKGGPPNGQETYADRNR